MSFWFPSNDQVYVTWVGEAAYTPPASDEVTVSWVGALYLLGDGVTGSFEVAGSSAPVEGDAVTGTWSIPSVVVSLRLAGLTSRGGVVGSATVYLLELVSMEVRAVATSDENGVFEFASIDGELLSVDEQYFLLCDYGTGFRPMAHGPVAPSIIEG